MNPAAAAQQRAKVILRVRGGQISATEGARELGTSRKTYYQWEKRGLQGMLRQLEQKPPGRPRKPKDPQRNTLQSRIRQLEASLRIAEQTAQARAILLDLRRAEAKRDAKKKKISSRKSWPRSESFNVNRA